MKFRTGKWFPLAAMILGVLIVVALAAAAMPLVGLPPIHDWWKRSAPSASPSAESEPSAELVPGQPDTLRLVPAVIQKLGIHVAEVKQLSSSGQLEPPHRTTSVDADGWTKAQVTEATQSGILHLFGTLGWDTNHLAQIRSRFPGEVVEIGTVAESAQSSLQTVSRPLRYGDKVTEGQLLVVVWNTDLGNKKNDLVDAITQLRLDRQNLKRVEDAYRKAAQTDVQLEQAKRSVEASMNRVAAVEATLRAWRVPEQEIKAVEQEAERIAERKGQRDVEQERLWPRVEMRAPFDGVIVEKSVALHNFVDTSTDLFKIAKLDKLNVFANAYEEDLPTLLALKPEQRRWQIRLEGDPNAKPLSGTIDVIGYSVDPNQHTAIVMGQVDNPDERLRAVQSITASVALPPKPDEVIIPTSALVEDGRESIVFVQPDLTKPYFRQQQVVVARREREVVFLSTASKPDRSRTEPSLQPGKTWVVASGSVELKAALEDLQPGAKQK
ncbi:MAG TPA: efflux RND transporter periplasmic adaptor subunit [Gemmataceae bacterium]|nr:efflux RND transporter periplasmic adaptor subunit [Gemmataceae bacterium]